MSEVRNWEPCLCAGRRGASRVSATCSQRAPLLGIRLPPVDRRANPHNMEYSTGARCWHRPTWSRVKSVSFALATMHTQDKHSHCLFQFKLWRVQMLSHAEMDKYAIFCPATLPVPVGLSCFSLRSHSPAESHCPADDTVCKWHTETYRQWCFSSFLILKHQLAACVGSAVASTAFISELMAQRCLCGAEVVRTERTSPPAAGHSASQ